jgi:hypothetical protein
MHNDVDRGIQMIKISTILFLSIVAFIVFIGVLFWWRISKLPKAKFKEAVRLLTPQYWKDNEFTVGWVGHSTVLMNMFGYKMITDPVFGQRVGQHLGRNLQVGPKRHTAPAISIEDVGKVDLILLSHAHFDHFDIPSLKRLAHP